jgi:hypothetical protein
LLQTAVIVSAAVLAVFLLLLWLLYFLGSLTSYWSVMLQLLMGATLFSLVWSIYRETGLLLWPFITFQVLLPHLSLFIIIQFLSFLFCSFLFFNFFVAIFWARSPGAAMLYSWLQVPIDDMGLPLLLCSRAVVDVRMASTTLCGCLLIYILYSGWTILSALACNRYFDDRRSTSAERQTRPIIFSTQV